MPGAQALRTRLHGSATTAERQTFSCKSLMQSLHSVIVHGLQYRKPQQLGYHLIRPLCFDHHTSKQR